MSHANQKYFFSSTLNHLPKLRLPRVRRPCHSECVEKEPTPLPTNPPAPSQAAINGAKSQGPTSPEGKARSSRNAEKHGMYTNAVLLHHESAEDFDALREDYYCQFAPASRAETDLVDRMIAATWRLRRLSALESAALDHAIDAQRSDVDAIYENLDPETRAHFAFEQLAEGVTLATYGRFQSTQLRQYDRALRNLLIIRAAAPKTGRK